jgi:hypothetical protein
VILIGADPLQPIVLLRQEKMETVPLEQAALEIEQMMAVLLVELATLAQ